MLLIMDINESVLVPWINRILPIQSPFYKKRFINYTKQEINEKARIVHHNVLARNLQPLYKLVTDVSYIH